MLRLALIRYTGILIAFCDCFYGQMARTQVCETCRLTMRYADHKRKNLVDTTVRNLPIPWHGSRRAAAPFLAVVASSNEDRYIAAP